MKELENINPDKLKVAEERPVKAENKFVGSMKIERGQKVWELDLTTRTIIEAVYETEAYHLVPGEMKSGVRKKLLMKSNCWYAVSINVRNARKKFLKRLKALKQQKP